MSEGSVRAFDLLPPHQHRYRLPQVLLQNGEHAIPLLADSFEEYLENQGYTFVNFVRVLLLICFLSFANAALLFGRRLLASFPCMPAYRLSHVHVHARTHTRQYAPWCVWCQRLAPTWEALAERAEQEQIPVKIAKARTPEQSKKGWGGMYRNGSGGMALFCWLRAMAIHPGIDE